MSTAAAARVQVIKDCDLLISAKDDQRVVDIVTNASFISKCPCSFFSILMGDKQVVKASFGGMEKGPAISPEDFSCDLEDSFCSHTLSLASFEPLIVHDAREHPEFKDNMFVVGPPFFRFYAGFPVKVSGEVIGALCCGSSLEQELQQHQVAGLYILRNNLETLLRNRYKKNTRGIRKLVRSLRRN